MKRVAKLFPIRYKKVVLNRYATVDNGSKLESVAHDGTRIFSARTKTPKTREWMRLDFPQDFCFQIDDLFEVFRHLLKQGKNRLRFIESEKDRAAAAEVQHFAETAALTPDSDIEMRRRIRDISERGTSGHVYQRLLVNSRISKGSKGKLEHRTPKVSLALHRLIRDKWQASDSPEDIRMQDIGTWYREDPTIIHRADYERAKDLTDNQLKKYGQSKPKNSH